MKYSQLSISRKRKFNNTPLRMIVLRENTTDEVKSDIFERINRGSDPLFSMEKRKGIIKGPFNDFIYNECAKNTDFKRLTPLATLVATRQEHEELILRFFALYDAYPSYSYTERTGIATYLDSYLQEMNEKVACEPQLLIEKRNLFNKMVAFVNNSFQYGFAKGDVKQVSRVYFEAISIGVALAFQEKPDLKRSKTSTQKWLSTGELAQIASGKYKTHNKARIQERVNYVKEALLANE